MQRSFDGWADHTLGIICALIAVGHIYVAFDPILSELQRNAFHFASFGFLAAVLTPALRGRAGSRGLLAFDLILGVAVFVSAVYLTFAENKES